MLITAAAVWWLAGLYLYLSPKLPEAEALTDIKLQTPLRIMSSDGQLIGQFGEQRIPAAMRISLRALLMHSLLRKTTAFRTLGIDYLGIGACRLGELVATGSKQWRLDHHNAGGKKFFLNAGSNFHP